MPPKKDADDKRPNRYGRSRIKEEEPAEPIEPQSEKETLLKDECVFPCI